MKGNYGKILKIELNLKKTHMEFPDEDIYKKYIGGKGLGTYLLLKENPQGVEPLSAENRLIFAIGPVIGTNIWGANRFAAYTKSPLTGFYAESYTGGKAFINFAKTGYDAIIINGKMENFGYLVITDEKVEFVEDEKLKGADAFETEKILEERYKKFNASAITIGIAGENLVRFAYINNDFGRSLGRTGIGAVMGSKNLKAIVFYGNSEKEIFSKEVLKEYNKELLQRGKQLDGFKAYRKYGTSLTVGYTMKINAFPSEYWHTGSVPFGEEINGDALINTLDVKAESCGYCFIGCTRKSRVKDGRRRGVLIDGPEYETINGFGGLNLVADLREISYINDVCDKLGIDTITAANITSFAVEAYKRGKINFKIEYGDVKAIVELLNLIAKREEVGEVLSYGVKRAAEELGLEEIAIHVKGLEPPGYDPRVLKGMGLSFGVSDRGACHLRTTFYKPELAGVISPEEIKGKAELLIEYENRLTIYDTLILCRFFRDIVYYDEIKKILYITMGIEYSENRLKEIAKEITDMAREFNLREGMKQPDDDMLPDIFFKNPFDKNSLTKGEYISLLKDYYRLKNWDIKFNS
jgi:aldehyde:ferredoxin oxidoreductase